jgi:hypothetical protein
LTSFFSFIVGVEVIVAPDHTQSEAWTMTKKEEQALLIFKGKYLEEYMVLNMKTGNGKVGQTEN